MGLAHPAKDGHGGGADVGAPRQRSDGRDLLLARDQGRARQGQVGGRHTEHGAARSADGEEHGLYARILPNGPVSVNRSIP